MERISNNSENKNSLARRSASILTIAGLAFSMAACGSNESESQNTTNGISVNESEIDSTDTQNETTQPESYDEYQNTGIGKVFPGDSFNSGECKTGEKFDVGDYADNYQYMKDVCYGDLPGLTSGSGDIHEWGDPHRDNDSGYYDEGGYYTVLADYNVGKIPKNHEHKHYWFFTKDASGDGVWTIDQVCDFHSPNLMQVDDLLRNLIDDIDLEAELAENGEDPLCE